MVNYDVFISYNSTDKYIADAVCHYLEAKRLRCFIAPRDIVTSDWAGSITAAIENAKAFVVVVSENSILSNEVAKEITLATRVSNFIFPFRIDDSELDRRMSYHLSAFHWIDAVTPPLEEKLKELADRVEMALNGNVDNVELGSVNTKRQRLLGHNIRPRAEFVGRSRELQEIEELFASGIQSVFLCGMGGIGKSEIAKAYAKAHSDIYKTVVFASYETDLLHLIANDQVISVENLKQASATGGAGETAEDYYERKMKVLRSIVEKDTLLIIDNFDVENDEHMEEVMQLPCKILWTTRTDFGVYGFDTVKVGPIENFEDLVKLFTKVDKAYTSEEDKNAVRDIIRLLECHTYAVSLTAAQMKAGRIKPVKMLTQLKEEGLKIQTKSSFSRDIGSKRGTAYEFIQALFDFSSLDEYSCDILRYLACMPMEGADIDLFMECCAIEDFGDIQRLVDLNWVQLDDENDKIGLHMLVKEMIWERLTPTVENCAVMLKGVYQWAYNAWNKTYDENFSHSPFVYALLEAFPEPTIEVLDYFEDYATFAWIQGRFDLAEKCEHKLYILCVECYGEISVPAGNQALRVAAVYHNQGDYAGARPWYEKGLKVQESIDKESFEAYIARAKVARSNAQSYNYEAAETLFIYNLEIMGKIYRKAEVGEAGSIPFRNAQVNFAYAKQNVAQVYCALGRYEEALGLALQSYDYLKTDQVEPSLVLYTMMALVDIYRGLQEYDQAIDYAKQALKGHLHYHGEATKDTWLFRETLGDLYAMIDRFEDAEDEYAQTLSGREKYFPSDVKSMERVEEKYFLAKEGKCSTMPQRISWG